MKAVRPRLVLVSESEAVCRNRLSASGYSQQATLEISSYLAQSTDIAAELPEIERACEKVGVDFEPVELDRFVNGPPRADIPALVWTLTDGIQYFSGSLVPSLSLSRNMKAFGSDPSLFALAQDKFRSGAALRELGLPCPKAGLARNGQWIVPPPPSQRGWFVKPNRLGAKIGIWKDSHCFDFGHALEISRRVYQQYRDDVVVQPYVGGRNVRASFLAVETDASVAGRLGIAFVDSGHDFQTMEDSLALYGETGDAAKVSGIYAEPELSPVSGESPGIDAAIRDMILKMSEGLGLRDVYSVDLRVEDSGALHLLEFEVCPGLPCFDFRDYCRRVWGLSLPEAMAQTASRRLRL